MKDLKKFNQKKRVLRTRHQLKSNGTRLRLVFNKTNRYLISQIVDDKTGTTLVYATTLEKAIKIEGLNKKNKEAAKILGKEIASRAQQKGIKQVMLDRSGMIYHGKLVSFADSAREAGLEF